MQNLLNGRINMSEELVNRLVTEFTEGTEYAKQFRVTLAGADKAVIAIQKPIHDVNGVSLFLTGVWHNQNETAIQFKVDDVTTSSLLMKPLISVLKNKFMGWLLQKIVASKLPPGIQCSVNGATIKLEIRKWLQNKDASAIVFPVLGKLIDTMEISSARIDPGEVVVETKIVG